MNYTVPTNFQKDTTHRAKVAAKIGVKLLPGIAGRFA
jgi:hypothetical protein